MYAALGLLALLVLLMIVGLATVVLYNRLVRGRLFVREGFSGVDVQLKKRHDLIPNLVQTVEGYADFERGVLTEVTNLRTKAMGDYDVAEKQRDENQLTGALKTLFAVAENYPDLKANSNFLDLQRQLGEIESDLEKARRYYNGTVRDYNTQVEMFPSNLVAGLFNFEPATFFELDSAAEAAVPQVQFGGKGKS
ncbi:MAG: LemA family protein [Pirellulaceae bacterium]